MNYRIMLEPVPAQPLPFRNIDLSIVVLLDKHDNNNINKATPYAISFDNTNYILCLYNLQGRRKQFQIEGAPKVQPQNESRSRNLITK